MLVLFIFFLQTHAKNRSRHSMQDSHLNTILDFKPTEVMNGSNVYMEITDISSERLEIWVWGGYSVSAGGRLSFL